jgi:anti-anti-sigma factor
MTKWTYDAEQKAGELQILGDLTVAHASVLKDALLQAFEKAEQVAVNIKDVAEFDVAGLQLLCASHRFAADRGRRMSLLVHGNPSFLHLVSEAGFSQSLFCVVEPEHACLWSEDLEKNNS